jgi:hypothetical protein
MFKILVDGRTHGSYTDDTVCVTVGSAADADVKLPSADAEHIKIYPLHGSYGGCFKVTVHAPDGMTQHTKHWTGRRQTIRWTPNPPYWLTGVCATENSLFLHGEKPGWVLVYGGDTLTIKDRNIQVINYCGTCGRRGMPHDQLWECTCAGRAT